MNTTNENCLLNRACPQCKQDEEILLYTARWTSVKDDGTDDDAPSIDRNSIDRSLAFDDDDSAKCPLCTWFGTWKETETIPEPSVYERVCREVGLNPENERDPVNHILLGALAAEDPDAILEDDIAFLTRMAPVLRHTLDNPAGPDEVG